MKISSLCKVLGIQDIAVEQAVSGYSIDSRTTKAGDLFIAISGEQFDGHEFVAQAQQRGAVAAVVSRAVAIDLPTLVVNDTREALGLIAQHHRQKYPLAAVALTGSSGKTTLKEMLSCILSQQANVLATAGNYNNDIGVPLTLFRLNAEHDYAVIEIGANHRGEIAQLAQLVQPKIALVNNVQAAHISGFGSLQGVAEEKSDIYLALADDGVAIVNADLPYQALFAEKIANKKIIQFALQQSADVYATQIEFNEFAQAHFQLHTPRGVCALQLQLSGEHNVANALAAAAVCIALDIPLDIIRSGLQKTTAFAGRLVIQTGVNGATIIDDSYNANMGSVQAALNVLAQRRGQRIFVLGDLGEQGSQEQQCHQRIGEYAREKGIEQLYTCGPLSRLSFAAFSGAGQAFDDHASLVAQLLPQLDQDCTVLIKGSRAARMEQIVNALVKQDVC